MSMVLETRGISKTYGNDRIKVRALRTCDLTVEKGEFVAVIGKSGSGKSTLLRMLGTLEPPDEGEIFLEGKSLRGMSDAQLSRLRRRRIGFVYQDYSLFPEFTAYENIVMPFHLDGRRENKSYIREVMDTLGILECRDRFPSEMSGGEQQRVAIARGVCISPAIILADVPTGILDADIAEEVAMLMSRASQMYQQTIIMVTHDGQMADYADRILHIRDGKVQEQGKGGEKR